MPLIGLVVLFFWLVTAIRLHLFWLYLWQLKNYHIGRFRAHFSTTNGRHALFNKVWFLKLILLLGSSVIFFPVFFNENTLIFGLRPENFIWVLPFTFLVYIFEGCRSLFFFFKKTAKFPKFTNKIIFLLPLIFIPLGVVIVVFTGLFIDDFNSNHAYNLIASAGMLAPVTLIFDLLTPLIVSAIVLFFQPVTVVLRHRILKRAIARRQLLENLLVIGITGSYGKSSVKEFLKMILGESFKVVATEKNMNSEVGIAETILEKIREEDEIFICEMGAYNRGGIKLLTKIAAPKIGVLTGIGNQHLATFGSQKNIMRAKFELIDALPEEGLAILNWDSPLVRANFKNDKNSIKYGLSVREDVWAENIKVEKFSVSFDAVFKTGEKMEFTLSLIGAQHIPNFLAALAIAKRLGMENEEIKRGTDKIKEKQGGLEIIKNKDKIYIANSSYSSNLDGALAHLDYLKVWDARKIFVMPCLIELGSAAKTAHYELGQKIGQTCDYLIATTADYFKDLKRGAVENGMSAENIFLIQNPEIQYQKIMNLAKPESLVFLEGRVSDYLLKGLYPVK